MELVFLPAEVILNHPRSTLGHLYLDWNPQPGTYLELEGQSYLILERSNRYHLKSGKYKLKKISLYVQKSNSSAQKSLLDGRWIMGDPSCLFNARSELLQCAVNPSGSCDRCIHYQKLEDF
jgi:hypothetical protein